MAPQTGVNGVLPVSVLKKNTPASAPRGPKAASPKLKLVVRRLPPGLTKAEFENILGEEWKLGAGKVDWFLYKNGKISKDLAKPSRPARAYLQVTSQQYVPILGDHVRNTHFNDAAKSAQDGALIGPPTLEYAPYHRMPGGRKKHDSRQGTIDQDQEFKDFLESLTNPITKPAAPEDDGQKNAKVTTTPLIEALREKKASKERPQAKSGKHGRESKEDAPEKADKKILTKGSKDTSSTPNEKGRRPTKTEKATKEAVKVLNKEVASKAATPSPAAEKASPAPASERRRGNTTIAKTLLQRDLGITPPNRRRGTKREVAPTATPTPATPTTATKTEETPSGKNQKAKEVHVPAAVAALEKAVPTPAKKTSRAERRAGKGTLGDRTNSRAGEESKAQAKAIASPPPTILKKPQTNSIPMGPKGPANPRVPPTEPAASRAASQPQAKSEAIPPTRPQVAPQSAPSAPAPTPTGRQAFLKHANPSQGITEPLIEEALKLFGTIEKVEIDKRKGFAYVDFADLEGLRKAIAASPIKIAQGAVQVLERKEKVVRTRPHPGPHGPPPTGPARGGRGGFAGRGRGGRGGGRGGHAASIAAAASGEAAPASPAPATTPAVKDAAT